jgi:hypothetical protein
MENLEYDIVESEAVSPGCAMDFLRMMEEYRFSSEFSADSTCSEKDTENCLDF